MMLNLKLEGFPEEIIGLTVAKGIASNKSEAIRMMVLFYNEQKNVLPLSRYLEDGLAVKKMQRLNKEIGEGKRKTLNSRQALGKYAKYLE